ncbi:voltage-gated sodium channel [Murinocardiopsis flavida]|uniref:Voltage-gated sodium channel n=1 Tax=Murinocardiopsis flavida TaxID=645275 RepID=A0A2P8CUX4_9ACTN|nr:ion transporter [Murinocardiopsis flavida]PSK88771.1 voltage-gated sodium channel [Murinocardiopsis flavida]
MTLRDRVRTMVEAGWFQSGVVALILFNGILLGVETSPSLMARYSEELHWADMTILAVFMLELGMRIFAHRWAFFRDPWGWFDLVIVLIALVPTSGPFAVLRVLRILRVLRLLSAVPALRHVVTGLLRALPGMASIAFLVGLLLYVAAVMATTMFRGTAPEYFGNLGDSLFTLFQIMTGDSWGAIAKTVMAEQPMAWIFFVGYILASTFIALNLFIAVAVEALDFDKPAAGPKGPAPDGSESDGPESDGPASDGPAPDAAAGGADASSDGAGRADLILAELRALRAEVAELRGKGGPP